MRGRYETVVGPVQENGTWIVKQGSREYLCFKGRFGELYHFEKNALMRGKPGPPYTCAEDFTRPEHFLTLKEAENISGLTIAILKRRIHRGLLKATKKFYAQGIIRRRFWIIDKKDLVELVARESLLKYTGNKVIWDKAAMDVLDESA